MRENPIGKYFLFPRGTTIVKVIAVEDSPVPGSEMHLMTFIDLRDDSEHGANFIEEIGDEFKPLPAEFPQTKIDAYVQAANNREAANELLYGLDLEIELGVSDNVNP